MNHVIHIAAIVQIRHDTPGRAYYRRKLAQSKTPMEALRCLKRRIPTRSTASSSRRRPQQCGSRRRCCTTR